MFVPAGLCAGAAAAADLPSVTRTEVEIGHVMAIGWPSGRHPVIVGQQAILDCLDDACARYTTTQLGVIM